MTARHKFPKGTTSCILYTVIWQLYYVQQALGIGVIAKYLLFIIIAISLYKTVYVWTHYKVGIFLKVLAAFFILLNIYGIYHLWFGPIRHISETGIVVEQFSYLKYIYCSIPVVFVYYDYAKRGVLNERFLYYCTWFYIAISTYSFFSYYYFLPFGQGAFEYVDGLTNNNGYKFASIIPLIFLIKKHRLLMISICVFFIILSLKRGAMLIGVISMLVYIRCMIAENKGYKKALAIFTGIIILFASSISFLYFYENSAGLRNRIEMTIEGNSSGRDQIYNTLFDFYKSQTDVSKLIFGNGADATIDIAGNYAHNDWIELLINQGALGAIVFALLYFMWYLNWRKLRRIAPRNVSATFGLTLLSNFLCSIFSMAYTGFSPSLSMAICACLCHNHISPKASINTI